MEPLSAKLNNCLAQLSTNWPLPPCWPTWLVWADDFRQTGVATPAEVHAPDPCVLSENEASQRSSTCGKFLFFCWVFFHYLPPIQKSKQRMRFLPSRYVGVAHKASTKAPSRCSGFHPCESFEFILRRKRPFQCDDWRQIWGSSVFETLPSGSAGVQLENRLLCRRNESKAKNRIHGAITNVNGGLTIPCLLLHLVTASGKRGTGTDRMSYLCFMNRIKWYHVSVWGTFLRLSNWRDPRCPLDVAPLAIRLPLNKLVAPDSTSRLLSTLSEANVRRPAVVLGNPARQIVEKSWIY